MKTRVRACVLIGMCALLIRIAAGTEERPKEPAPVNDPAFHPLLLEIAEKYEAFGRVDDLARFAPLYCRMPPASVARVSESTDATTHGQKLYFLFAKERDQYLNVDKEIPVGQSIVKEAWLPKEVPLDQALRPVEKKIVLSEAEAKAAGVSTVFDHYVPYAKKDGKVLHAETKAGLFIMSKLDAKTPNTDEGWVYGTVSADGKTVTSAGRVQACMKCHQEAPHGRLFGLKQELNADAAPLAKVCGEWSGTWVDTWKFKGQGGELTCTVSAGASDELRAVFKAPGFLADTQEVMLKLKAAGAGYSADGSADMGRPAGVLTFKIQITEKAFTGEYDGAEERGKFEMKKK